MDFRVRLLADFVAVWLVALVAVAVFVAVVLGDVALRGVAVLAGTDFGCYGEGHLRFSSSNSDHLLNEACNKLKQLTLEYV